MKGEGHIFHQVFVFAESDVFHWFLLSLKVKASGGGGGQTPHISNDTANNIKYSTTTKK